MPMIRKQIYIEPLQRDRLKQLSRDMGISEAELIRQGIEHYLSMPFQFPRDPEAWKEAKKLMVNRLKKGSSGGKRTWKRDDIYE